MAWIKAVTMGKRATDRSGVFIVVAELAGHGDGWMWNEEERNQAWFQGFCDREAGVEGVKLQHIEC